MGIKLIYISIILLGIYFFADYQAKQLPEPKEINRSLIRMPKQSASASETEFVFDYEGETYLVKPKADYELFGLVVSHNNIGSISDSYHNAKSVDLKDLCVVYASNVIDDIYKKASFKSGSWTCYAKWGPGVAFNMEHLSNNHLLSDDPVVREKIKSVNIGDQVSIKGFLVDYANEKTPDLLRKSSMTRKDRGNTACEVFFVTEINILKRNNPFWYGLKTLSLYLSIGFALAYLYYLLIHSSVVFNRKKELVEQGSKFKGFKE